MYRWTDLADVPAGFGPSVVTIGNFDGVHRGHVGVLTRLVADARAAGARSVAVTFSPHPSQVHRPGTAAPLLTGDVDRLELLAETGLDAVLLLEYTLDFADQSAEQFVRRYLVEGLAAQTVVVGHDVRFGRGNAGDLTTMIELGRTYGFTVEVIDDVAPTRGARAARPAASTRAPKGIAGVDDAAPGAGLRRWSSTQVRELLEAGDVAGAAQVLGRPHRMRAVVVHGDARGRQLGFPTANLAPDATGMVPADGVYAGWLRPLTSPGAPAASATDVLPAAISVGTNPTFEGVRRRVEAYVLDRLDLELYDREVVLEFVDLLRPTLRFASIEALITQMGLDVERVRHVLGTDRTRG